MSSSDPQPPVAPGGPTPSNTQEIPVMKPASGATDVQQLPPHPNATAPAPVRPVDGPVPTGPVDFVPGLPGPGTPPPPPPAGRPPVSAPITAPGPVPSVSAPAAPAAGPDSGAHAAAEPTGAPARTWPESLEPDRRAAGHRKRPGVPLDRATFVGLGLVVLAAVLLELGLALDFGAESYWSALPLWSAFASVCVLLALVAFAAFSRTGDRGRAAPAWRIGAAGLVGLAVFWLLVVLPVVASDRGFLFTAALAALGGGLWIGFRRKD